MTTSERNGRVSIIIPAFNAERFLGEAIESVLSQTYTNIECIVVDDGSTDNTAAIARGFGDRVTYVYQENAERSAARNAGISVASGQYVAFLDADDALAANKLTDQVIFLETHPECSAVYSRVSFFLVGGERSSFSLDRPTPAGDILGPLLYGNFITVNAPLIRKSAVEAIGGFDPTLSHNEDWDFFLRLALSGVRFGLIDECHAFCRMHAANTSLDEIRMHESKWQVARRFVTGHRDELRQKGIAIEPVLSYHEADFGKSLIANGRAKDGRRHIFNACRRSFPRREKYFLFALFSYVLSRGMCARFGGGAYLAGKDEP